MFGFNLMSKNKTARQGYIESIIGYLRRKLAVLMKSSRSRIDVQSLKLQRSLRLS